MMYKEKQDKTKQNLAAASDTRMTTNATAAAAWETTTAGVATAGDLGEDNRKQDGEEDNEEEDIQEGDAEEDETQAQRITQK
jgi:hypothetical protein